MATDKVQDLLKEQYEEDLLQEEFRVFHICHDMAELIKTYGYDCMMSQVTDIVKERYIGINEEFNNIQWLHLYLFLIIKIIGF